MPVFTRNGCALLYMHVPKTGGTAIEAFFKKNGFRSTFIDKGGPESINRYRRCAPQHMSAQQIMAILRPGTFNYVFMTVRNPLSRAISEYKMRRRSTTDAPPLDDWFNQMLGRYVDDSFIAENHLRPQVEFFLPNCDVFRNENGFGLDFVERVESRLGFRLEHREVGRVNADENTEIPEADIERIAPRIRQFYSQDYLFFNY